MLAQISLTSLADAACVEVTMASHEAALSVGPTIVKAGGEVGKHGYLTLSQITVSAQEGERKKMGPGRFHIAADSVLLGMASSTKGKWGEGGKHKATPAVFSLCCREPGPTWRYSTHSDSFGQSSFRDRYQLSDCG